ncbi:MAG: glycosyltransferase family 2 protein [Pantoea sp. Brub]|nr:glycosyltransferase family 2 protein [Pantoea sp. Brub]
MLIKRQTLSVIIITKNEEHLLPDCLASVIWADEIIVVDSGSTDNTINIAKKAGVKVFYKKNWQGYGKQRQYAQNFAKSNMIFMIDADERITIKLRKSIEDILYSMPTNNVVYSVRRYNMFLGHLIRYSGWNPDYVIRLYPRILSYNDNLVHESLKINKERVKRLNGGLQHLTCYNLINFQQKQLFYAESWAIQRYQQGQTCNFFSIFMHTIYSFLKTIILHTGFLDGKLGWILSIINSQYTFNKYLKLWLLNNIINNNNI